MHFDKTSWSITQSVPAHQFQEQTLRISPFLLQLQKLFRLEPQLLACVDVDKRLFRLEPQLLARVDVDKRLFRLEPQLLARVDVDKRIQISVKSYMTLVFKVKSLVFLL